MDRREEILEAIKAFAIALTGFNVYRNDLNIPDDKLPAIVILDADEIADESSYGRGRPAQSPVIVGMTPEIFFLLQEETEACGSALNALRGRFIKGILSDPTLVELCHNGDIRYEAFSTSFAGGREMNGQAGISFRFNYVMRPDKF